MGGCSSTQAVQPTVQSNEKAPDPLFCLKPRPSVDVTQRGIKLSFLQRLVHTEAVPATWTIQEAVDRFVRPETAASKCCLFDIVPVEATSAHPRFFVSHTWSRQVGELVALLQRHFDVQGQTQDSADACIWLDIFAINQHPYEQRGSLLEDDVSRLAQVVQATDCTLFCLDPDCSSLTRIWCLFEVWQTLLAKSVKGLLVLTSSVDVGKLTQVFKTFDVLAAQATQPEDRDRILLQIQRSIGATELNLQLKQAIVESAVYEAEHTAAQGEALAGVQTKAGEMLRAQGQLGQAEHLLRAAVETRMRVHEHDDHPDVLSAVNNCALCLLSQGGPSLSEAEGLLRRVAEGRARRLGAEHLLTLDAWSNLSQAVDAQGRGKEAEAILRRVLDARRRALRSDDHPAVLDAMSNLAVCISAQGPAGAAEAEGWLTQVLDRRVQTLGAEHPDSIDAVLNLAYAVSASGRDATAEQMFRQAAEARAKVLGQQHVDTLTALSNLYCCVSRQGRAAEAEPGLAEVAAARARLLGDDSEHTIEAVGNLVSCLMDQGKRSQAQPLLVRLADAKAQALGPEQPASIASLNSVAVNLSALGRAAEAEEVFSKVLELKQRVLGMDHADVADCMYNLGCVLHAAGKCSEAEDRFRSAAQVYVQVHGPNSTDAADAEARALACREHR